jgi:hypothetical protein
MATNLGMRSCSSLLCQAALLIRLEIFTQWYRDRHDEPPSFATSDLDSPDFGIRHKSVFQRFGIYAQSRNGDVRYSRVELLVTACRVASFGVDSISIYDATRQTLDLTLKMVQQRPRVRAPE